MALEIFKLFGSIFVDGSKAEESIAKTDNKASKLAENLGNGIKTAAKWGAGIATGAAAAVSSITALAVKSAEATDRIDKMSQKIGISKQSFQEWDYIMAQNGMDVDKLQVGVKTLVSQMNSAEVGGKNATEAFGALGLTWQDGNGKLKSQEQMLNETMIALANMENGTRKAKLATELFGKAGIEMMPMLNGGANAITELKDRAYDLGLVLSDDSVDAGVVLGDTIDDVKKSFGSIITKIGVEFMPMIQNLLDAVLTNMPLIQEIFGGVFSFIGNVAGTAIDWIGQFIGWIQKLIDEAQTEGTTLNIFFEKVSEIIRKASEKVIEIVGAIIEKFNSIVDWIQNNKTLVETIGIIIGSFAAAWGLLNIAIGIWNAIGAIATAVTTGFGAAVAFLTSPITIVTLAIGAVIAIVVLLIKHWDDVKEAGAKAWNWIKGIWNNAAEWFNKNIIEPIGNFFGNLWDNTKEVCINAWNGIIEFFINIVPNMIELGKNIFGGLWDGIKNVWSNISNWVSEKVSWLVDKLTFWKKGNDEMSKTTTGYDNTKPAPRINGRHASGLSYVPFNGYIGELHKGEEVVSNSDKQSILDILKALALGGQGGGQKVELVVNLNGQTLARELYDPLQRQSRLQGTNLAQGVL